MSGSQNEILDKAINAIKKGSEQEELGEIPNAIESYKLGLKYLQHELKYTNNPEYAAVLNEKIDTHKKKIDTLSGKPEKEKEGGKLREEIEATLLTTNLGITWEDVIGLEQAKEAVQEAVVLPLRFSSLFQGKRKPWKGILLYGPSGTGKSLLAKAAASVTGATFFSVSSSNLVSKWVGESQKLISCLFELAREKKPAIIFIDELDSLFGARGGEKDSNASQGIKTELLIQMDGVGKDNQGVLVFGATNIPWELDPAFRRRFEKKIYIGLPQTPERIGMLKHHLGTEENTLTNDDMSFLAVKTDGYSGADMACLVQEALMLPFRRMQKATHFRKCRRTGKYISCSPGHPEALSRQLGDLPDNSIALEPLCLEDFICALTTVRPTVTKKDVENYTEFTKSFGLS